MATRPIPPALRPSALHLRPSAFPTLFASILVAASSLVHAEVTVKDAWVRGTVPAQKSTGAFMTLTSSEDAKVVAAASPIAKIVEIHSSGMSGGVMRMHAVEAIELPARREVRLQPGGLHVMLMGLAAPARPGETVPITLTIVDKRGARTQLEVKAEVRPLGR